MAIAAFEILKIRIRGALSDGVGTLSDMFGITARAERKELERKMAEARAILSNPDYPGDNQYLLGVEFGRNERDILKNLDALVKEYGVETAKEGLTLLSQHRGVLRRDGVMSSLPEAMCNYNKGRNPSGSAPAFPEELIAHAESLIEGQRSLSNQQRAENAQQAHNTYHQRYPQTFLNEITFRPAQPSPPGRDATHE